MAIVSDRPTIIRGSQEDLYALYHSDPNAALKVPVTISAGWGELKRGTALAVNNSGAGSGRHGQYQPYDPTATITGAENAPGRAYLVQDGAANTSVYVTLDDSYKFAVGDNLYVVDSGTAARDLGAITAIDRTTYTHMAVITVTNNVTTSYTTAEFAYVVNKGYDVCKGILEKTVDTGEGSDAKGALATMIIKNAIVHTGVLVNVDSAAKTDLSASESGQYTYF